MQTVAEGVGTPAAWAGGNNQGIDRTAVQARVALLVPAQKGGCRLEWHQHGGIPALVCRSGGGLCRQVGIGINAVRVLDLVGRRERPWLYSGGRRGEPMAGN